MPKRGEPEVIVFEQPTFKKRKETSTKERQLCRSADVSELFSRGQSGKLHQNERRPPEELDFKATLREVQKYANGITIPTGISSTMAKKYDTTARDIKRKLQQVEKHVSCSSSSLTGRDKRRYEEEQIVALGGRPSKRQKVPYPIYQERVRAKREKEKQRAQELQLAGMEVQKKKRERRQAKGRGRWRDSLRGLGPHIGVFQGGALRLSKQDMARVISGKRKH